MDNQEIHFWTRQVDEGTLIREIHANSERAIKFFGEAAVSREHEGELYRIIEAYDIVNSSEADLVAEMNRVADAAATENDKNSSSEVRTYGRQLSRFTLRDALAIKKKAEEYLKRLNS